MHRACVYVLGWSIESIEVLTLESCVAAGALGTFRSSMRRQQFSCYLSIYLHDGIKPMDVQTLVRIQHQLTY